MSTGVSRIHPLLAAFRPVVSLALAFAASTAAAQSAGPPPDGAPGNAFDGILQALDLKPKPTQAPDFVRASRPDSRHNDFIPIGRPHPDRATKVMTPAEVAATTAALDTSRVAQQRRAGVTPPAVPLKKSKADAVPSAGTSVR